MQQFRFTLSHEIEGSLVISDPAGWDKAVLGFERHPEFYSLVEFYRSNFGAYGSNGTENGGRDWLKNVENIHGPDSTIDILTEYSEDDQPFEILFEGTIPISSFTEMLDDDHMIELVFSQKDFWNKFISRYETPVDVQSPEGLDGDEVDVINPIDLPMSSQKIRQSFKGSYDIGVSIPEPDDSDFVDKYVQFDTPRVELDEISDKFHIPTDLNLERPVWLWAMEYAGSYNFDLRLEVSDRTGIGAGTSPVTGLLKVFFQINDETPIEFTSADFDNLTDESTVFTYNDTHDLAVGYLVRIYAFITTDLVLLYLWGEANPDLTVLFERFAPSGNVNPSYFIVTADTIFPETESPALLTYDFARSVIDRTVSENNTLVSEFMGGPATSPPYDYPGCAYKFVNIKFLHLRGYSLAEKQFFASFKDFWEGFNPIFNAGLGYTDDNKIEITEKADFFDEEMVIFLSNVKKITRVYDKDLYFNAVELGYNQWQTEDISGIDDPQTKRTWASRFKNIGRKISIISSWIAASLTFEQARRTTRAKSADYKYDNDIGIIAVEEDEYGFHPELSENFTGVTDLLNEETRYNKRLTVGRNFLRWSNFLNSGLQNYLSSVWKFVSGEGNYDMQATMAADGCRGDFDGEPLSEKQDLPVTDDYLFTPQAYSIEHYLTWDDYKILRANRKKAIGISQTSTGHQPFFAKDLQWSIADGELKLVAWPKRPFNIQVIEDTGTEHESVGHIFDSSFDLTFE